MPNDLRSMIRTLIEQELSTITVDAREPDRAQLPSSDFQQSTPAPREEQIRLSSDQDVAAFVQRILKLVEKPAGRQALASGQHKFRLATGTTERAQDNLVNTASEPTDAVSRVEHGLLTERECGRLGPGVKLLIIGVGVRVTPLASDWLRRKGITIKRAES